MEVLHIGILGAGLMGHGLAQVFAVQKYHVTLYDRDERALSESLSRVQSNMEIFVSMGLLDADKVEKSLRRIHSVKDVAAMCHGRSPVIEAISENLLIKQQAFAEMEQHVSPATILASNTSAISITSIAENLIHPDRVVGTHFWNPPHIVPCVEVIKADKNSDDVFEQTYAWMERVGKSPVHVLKDVPGFLGNRMQHALWREAIKLVESGIASAEDVDKVVRNAFGLRLAFLGPLETAALAGLDLVYDIHDDLFPHLDRSTEPSPLLEEKVKRGNTGVKSGKGFHPWPEEKVKRPLNRRDKVLLRILQQIDEH